MSVPVMEISLRFIYPLPTLVRESTHSNSTPIVMANICLGLVDRWMGFQCHLLPLKGLFTSSTTSGVEVTQCWRVELNHERGSFEPSAVCAVC